MSARFKIATAAVLSTMFASGAYAALYGFGPAEAWTIQQIVQQTASVTSSITKFGSTYGAQMQKSAEQQLSAIAIATKQEALSANVISDGNRQAAEQLISAIRSQRQSEQIATAYMKYNPATGQGYDPCGTVAKNRTMDVAFESAAAQARTAMGTTDVAPGRLVGSTARAMQERLQAHREKFCTPSEAKAGLCKESALPGGDINAAMLFESADSDSLESQAKMAYIQHVLGSPDQAVDKAAGGTPAGETYLMLKNRKDALLSIPAYTMAMAAASTTRSEELGGKSPAEVMQLRVQQYFGGPESERWAASLARQMDRGLLVESAKLEGLETWMSFKQYQQNQRMEANLAALLLASADKLTPALRAQYQKVLSDNTSANISAGATR